MQITLVTGRTQEKYALVSKLIPHDTAILEHGCLVLSSGNIDQEWYAALRVDGLLRDYEAYLQGLGYQTDSRGRLASFRVYRDLPHTLTEEEKQTIEGLPRPMELVPVRNMSFLDFIPAAGGKSHAIRYVEGKTKSRESFGFGDDYNDLEMLALVTHPITLGSAKPEVQHAVAARGGYVARGGYHTGTIEALTYILNTCHHG